MKIIIINLCFLILSSKANAQQLIRQTDSIINAIESLNSFDIRSKCDTGIASHSDYMVTFCKEFYQYNHKIFKIVEKIDRTRISDFYEKNFSLKPQELGTIKMTVFYFDNDSLIKVSFRDYSANSAAIYYHYFTQDEIRRLKWLAEKYKDQYCQTRDWFEEAENLVAEFRQEQ